MCISDDVFQISEISIHEDEYEDSTYTVSGDIMDGVSCTVSYYVNYNAKLLEHITTIKDAKNEVKWIYKQVKWILNA